MFSLLFVFFFFCFVYVLYLLSISATVWYMSCSGWWWLLMMEEDKWCPGLVPAWPMCTLLLSNCSCLPNPGLASSHGLISSASLFCLNCVLVIRVQPLYTKYITFLQITCCHILPWSHGTIPGCPQCSWGVSCPSCVQIRWWSGIPSSLSGPSDRG